MARDKRIIQAKSKLQIGLPAKKIEGSLINAIKNTCVKHKSIKNCYLFMKGVEHQETPLLTLGILFSSLEKNIVNSTMKNIVDTLETHLSEEQQMDLMIINKNPDIIKTLQKLKGVAIF